MPQGTVDVFVWASYFISCINMFRNASTTLGSNCVPLHRLNSSIAKSMPGEGLYGLSAVSTPLF